MHLAVRRVAVLRQQVGQLHTAAAKQWLYNPWQGWLNVVWNRMDESRIKEVGADHAVAEWMLRVGGQVMIKGERQWLSSYNGIPSRKFSITGLDAMGSEVTDDGLEHVTLVPHIDTLLLGGCKNVTDEGVKYLRKTPELRVLDLKLTQITAASADTLASLSKLEELDVSNTELASADAVNRIFDRLPNCNIKVQ